MSRKFHLSQPKGFSLVELLVVIAVIAILAGIGIAGIASIRESAELAKNQRNAQMIASLYRSAVGVGMSTNGITSRSNAIAVITEGTNIPSGNATYSFRLDGMSAYEVEKAEAHLAFTNGILSFSLVPAP